MGSIRSIESARIRPLVAQVFPLEQIVDAQKAFLSKQHVGKIVLQVSET
jgi:NADPH:quinone reductase-like Zn-dependent oxidoreductase